MHRSIIESQNETFLLVFRYPYRENFSGYMTPSSFGLCEKDILVFETDDASDARFFTHIRSCVPDFKQFIVLILNEGNSETLPDSWRQLAGLLAYFPQKTFLVASENCPVGAKCSQIISKNHIFMAERPEKIHDALKKCLINFHEFNTI